MNKNRKLKEENRKRFGNGSCLELLERAKRGTDFDFALIKIQSNFIHGVSAILKTEREDAERIIDIIDILKKYKDEYKIVTTTLGQLI